MSFTINASKLQQDTVSISFDFESQLTVGETLTAAVCTMHVFSGEDANPESMVDGTATFDGAIVKQKVTGGVVGVVYVMNCSVTTSLEQEITMQTYVAVVSTNPF